MLTHLFAVLGLSALCAAWVLFQLWLQRVDPRADEAGRSCSGCGNCGSKSAEQDDKKAMQADRHPG